MLFVPSMREEAARRGRTMRDQLLPPKDLITFWVEYVVRHDGARHLRSPFIDMPWYDI